MTPVVWTAAALADLEATSCQFMDESIEELVHGNYRIVYRLGIASVEVETVFYGARLLRLSDGGSPP